MEGMYLVRKSAIGPDRAMAREAERMVSLPLPVRTINVDRLHQSSVPSCLVARTADLQPIPP